MSGDRHSIAEDAKLLTDPDEITPTIPEQIAANKDPYYKALESADKAWASGNLDVSALETLLSDMLAHQLLSAAKEAAGESTERSGGSGFH